MDHNEPTLYLPVSELVSWKINQTLRSTIVHNATERKSSLYRIAHG